MKILTRLLSSLLDDMQESDLRDDSLKHPIAREINQ